MDAYLVDARAAREASERRDAELARQIADAKALVNARFSFNTNTPSRKTTFNSSGFASAFYEHNQYQVDGGLQALGGISEIAVGIIGLFGVAAEETFSGGGATPIAIPQALFLSAVIADGSDNFVTGLKKVFTSAAARTQLAQSLDYITKNELQSNYIAGNASLVLGLASGGVRRPQFSSLAPASTLSNGRYYHSTSPSAVSPIMEGGFRTDIPNPQAAFHNNRFGRGVYLADSPLTALAERPGGVILEVEANLGRALDILSRGPILDADMAKAIARGARKHGYDSIITPSVRPGGGVNSIILDPKNARAIGVAN